MTKVNPWEKLPLIKYIKTTWTVGREFEFPITLILSEMVKGIFDGHNAITEI